MKFIVFEGLDGSGKSTLMNRLKVELESLGQSVISTREPGGTLLGDEIRNLILSTKGEAPTPRTELLLYEASRSQHVDRLILPALQEGKWVLCDRFSASSIAFQGGGRELSIQQVEWLNDFATAGLQGHLTVLLDLSEELSRKRRQNRESVTGSEPDRIESEGQSFHEKVRASFLSQAQKNSNTWLTLNAENTPELLFEQLWKELKKRSWI